MMMMITMHRQYTMSRVVAVPWKLVKVSQERERNKGMGQGKAKHVHSKDKSRLCLIDCADLG